MSGTNQPQPNGSGDFKEYVNGGSDLTTFKAIPADYIQIIGAGTTVVYTEAGQAAATPYTRTLTTDSVEPTLVIKGPITQLVSTTATRVRLGYGTPPPIVGQVVAPVNLAGGANSVFGTIPAGNVQNWSSAGTIYASGFTPVLGGVSLFNFPASGDIYFPAISAAIDGQSVALGNYGTGATAVILHGALGGTANIGLRGSAVSGATSAAPTSLSAQTYTANVLTNTWVAGI